MSFKNILRLFGIYKFKCIRISVELDTFKDCDYCDGRGHRITGPHNPWDISYEDVCPCCNGKGEIFHSKYLK